MIYLQKNRKSKNGLGRTVAVAVAVIALVVGVKILFGAALDHAVLSVGGPIATVYVGVKNKIAFTGSFLRSRSALVEENGNLKNELEVSSVKLQRFDSVLNENRILLESYGRKTATTSSIFGNVIAKPPQSPYDVLIIDIGTENGVAVADAVYALGGIPIGRVDEVTGNTAKVIMFSSNGEETPAIHERTGATIILMGSGGGNLEAKIGQETNIEKKDAIVLPQFNGAVVATAVEVESTVTSASKRALFRIPINIFNLRYVEIVK